MATKTESAPLVLLHEQPLQRPFSERLRVHGAVATWTAGIFGLIYVVGPIAMAAMGWFAALGSVVFNAFAFAITIPALLLFLEIRKPEMHLQRSIDPVLPAAAGAFAMWALLHNTLPILRPFAAFSPGELIAFLALNGLEFTLFGVIFATLVRSRAGGFVAGALFQLGYIGAFVLGTILL